MQILPSGELISFIRHYLILESKGKNIKNLRLFSDGNPGMVFSFKNNLISTTNELLGYLPASFVYGQIKEFKDLYLTSEASLIIVVFQPAGLNRLLQISASELRDNIIQTEDLFGWQGASLLDKLSEQARLSDKLKLIDAFFIELASRKVVDNSILIEASLNFILKNKGTNSIHQLVKYTGYTERHIERIFTQRIGLSPKTFGNIVKLHTFLKLLKDKSKGNSLTRMSYEAGYFDQSHLIREFKRYTGITPNEYLHKTRKLATNFMEFQSAQVTGEAMSVLYNLKGRV